MILVDTNAWVTHVRSTDPRLVRMLQANRVVTCDIVEGELRLGAGLPTALAEALASLPKVPSPSAAQTLAEVTRHGQVFRASGVGWADAQIIVAAASAGALVYSSDRAVRTVWRRLGHRLP